MSDDAAVTIELADPTSPAVQSCLRAYYDELPSVMGIEVFVTATSPEDEAALYLPPDGACLLARVGERPVGTVSLARLDRVVGEVKRMWLAPDTRGRGLGRRLLTRLHDEARTLGYERLRLDTHGELHAARALYTSFGYHEVERYNDNPYAQLFFEVDLRDD